MTWLEFKRKVNAIASRLSSDEVPISFLHGETEICPHDITVECDTTGDIPTLIIDLKEGAEQ